MGINDITSAAVVRAQGELPPLPKRSLANVEAWDVNYWLDPNVITMTTDLCQEWRTKLLSDKFFIAARMPMSTTTITGSYRLPFVFGSPYSQTLKFNMWTPFTTFLTATLEYRPERHTFLANELPSAAGKHWAALGVGAVEPSSCPTGLNVAPGKWEIYANLLLDLHDQPDACEGCTAQFFYCYQGQESPLAGLGQHALAQSLGLDSYQGEGITCVGPTPIHLNTVGSRYLHLGGAAVAVITPTLPITLQEYIEAPFYPIALTMDYTSTMDGWHFYRGDWNSPDLNAPITANTKIVLTSVSPIWAVNHPVPADTPAGPHSLVITVSSATSPSLTSWDAVVLWAGEWVAPPGGQTRVYLPFMMK